MNRILRVSLLLVVGFVVGRLSHDHSASAQVANRPPPCQDVNGDGLSNLADAVFLLTHFFLGGPEPVCPEPESPEPRVVGLPDTGQTTCYDRGGNVVDCASNTCVGQDGLYATGCLSEVRFVNNGDGTVTDTCTGLMWQQDTADVNRNGERDATDWLDWCSALDYCENLGFAGYEDWRLPNLRELQSILDYGRSDPAIDPVFSAVSSSFWSSTSFAGVSRLAWSVNFSGGVLGLDSKDSLVAGLVRAVRNGP